MAGTLPSSWTISAEDSARIFHDTIAPQEVGPYLHLHHKDDGKQPLAVLIVGQTGAGKTRLAPELKQAMVDLGRDPAHFIADTYKTYHPYYEECLRSQPDKASILAGTAARQWLSMACEHAAAQRLDVLVESACRHPDDFCRLAEIFRAGGYKVRVAIMAVPEALSRIGVLVRYHRKLPEAHSGGLPLRMTPKKVHDDSYAGLAYAANFIDANATVVDSVIIARRYNMVAYRNEPAAESGGWLREGRAVDALEAERRRKLSPEESKTALEDMEELKQLDDPRVRAQLPEIETLLGHLDADPEGLANLEPLDPAAFVGQGLQ